MLFRVGVLIPLLFILTSSSVLAAVPSKCYGVNLGGWYDAPAIELLPPLTIAR